MLSRENRGAVAWLTLDRPDKLNAMPRSFWGELTETLRDIEADDAIRVVVFHGAGRCFSVGGDIEDFGEIGGVADRRALHARGARRLQGRRGAAQADDRRGSRPRARRRRRADARLRHRDRRRDRPLRHPRGRGRARPRPRRRARPQPGEPALDQVPGHDRPADRRAGGADRRPGQQGRAGGRAPRAPPPSSRRRSPPAPRWRSRSARRSSTATPGTATSTRSRRSRCCRARTTSRRASPPSPTAASRCSDDRRHRARRRRDAARASAASLGRRTPDKDALVFPDGRVSYRELADTSWGIARSLLALGVQAGRARRGPDDQPPGPGVDRVRRVADRRRGGADQRPLPHAPSCGS